MLHPTKVLLKIKTKKKLLLAIFRQSHDFDVTSSTRPRFAARSWFSTGMDFLGTCLFMSHAVISVQKPTPAPWQLVYSSLSARFARSPVQHARAVGF